MKIKCNGQDILSNNFTDKDKRKLDSVQFCANNYKHPVIEGYKHLPVGGQKGQVVTHDGTNATWKNFMDLFPNADDVFAYGVQFDTTIADPHLIRIGNLSMHKSLPIQSQLKGCIAKGGEIQYWLNEDDWRFKKNKGTEGLILTVTGGVYTINASEFSTLKYEKQWIKIGSVICQIDSINTTTKTATLVNNEQLSKLTAGRHDIEFGSVLNGYDGTVRVYCPEFYIKSIVEDTVCKVLISPTKIDDTYTHQPAILIDAYRSTVLNTVPKNMGYLSTLPVNSAISVVNTNTYCRGGDNRSSYDSYLTTDQFRTYLGKPRTNIPRPTMRTYSRNAKSQMLSYDQYKNIFYWLYVIEYANFNSQEAYNAALTNEGYRQGGLGAGITAMINWSTYNDTCPITPCGYGNFLGNKTGIKILNIPAFTYGSNNTQSPQTMKMPRWRGFDNPFGDIYTNLDGIIINADANNHYDKMDWVYTCQDADNYSDSINSSYRNIGSKIHQDGYTNAFNLGNAAHIIPYSVGGGGTKYICDYTYTGGRNNYLRSLLVGGRATDGLYTGLGMFCSNIFTTNGWQDVGFRTVSDFVSFPS